VSLEARIAAREQHADNTVFGSGSGSATVVPVNSGYRFEDGDGNEVTELPASGLENQKIPLTLHGGLADGDGSEQVLAAFLHDVPEGFLVYVDGKLANNAGGGTWSLPLTAGALPAIEIEAPRYWSGQEDLKLVVQTRDGNLPVESSELTIKLDVEPVANGIDIAPTLIFSKEGAIIPINLNAAMPDQDGSETAELTFTGLGPHVAFYAGDTLLEPGVGGFGYSYEGGVYTLTGLTPEQVDTLGFKQAAGVITGPVTVTAKTVDGDSQSAEVNGSFNVNITPEIATSGNNFWLYSGAPINGRGTADTDTIQLRYGEEVSGSELASNLDNIEVIDLGFAGSNRIDTLRVEDVIAMTDGRDTLKIFGDSDDSVSLDDPSAWTHAGQETEGGKTFNVYEGGGATLWVEQGVQGVIID